MPTVRQHHEATPYGVKHHLFPLALLTIGGRYSGTFTPRKGGVRFAVVFVDYFTKWVKVEALVNITAKSIERFLWKNVVCRYGILHAFVTDNGTQFDCDSFWKWCAELHIRNYFSSPRHPEANGQVEATNKTIFKILKRSWETEKEIG